MTRPLRAVGSALQVLLAVAAAAQPTPIDVGPALVIPAIQGTLPAGFEPGAGLPAGSGQAAGDVNGDGRDDLVIGRLVFFGPATGYAPDQTVAEPLLPVGDVDGDGFADAYGVPARPDVSIRLYRGSAGGYLDGVPVTIASTGAPLVLPDLAGPRTVGFGDVDGDGRADLAVVTATAPDTLASLVVVFGRGGTTVDTLVADLGLDEQTEAPCGTFPSGPCRLRTAGRPAVADLDDDGRDDVLVPVRAGPAGEYRIRTVGLPDSAEGLTVSTPFAPDGFSRVDPYGLRVIDIDGDGDVDVQLVGQLETTFFPSVARVGGTLINDGGALTGPVGRPLRPVGDLDGDGFEDAVASGAIGGIIGFGPATVSETGRLEFARTEGIGETLIPEVDGLTPVVLNIELVENADLDGDGRDEVVLEFLLADSTNARAGGFGRAIFDVDASGALTVDPVYYRGADFPVSAVRTTVGLGDVTGDGVDDLAVVYASTDYAADPRVEVLRGGDLTGPPVAVLRASAAPIPIDFGPEVTVDAALDPTAVVAGDFDGDGARDVAVTFSGLTQRFRQRILYPGAVGIWLGGAGVDAEPDWFYPCLDQYCSPTEASAVDFDGDGVDDLVFVPTTNGRVLIVSGGDPLPDPEDSDSEGWRGLLIPGSQLFPFRITVLDYDADGTPDLAFCDGSPSPYPIGGVGCRVYPGGMSGDSVVGLTAEDGRAAGLVSAAADVDGDGVDDFVSSSFSFFSLSPDATLDVYLGGTDADPAPDIRSDVLGDLGLLRRVGPTRAGFFGEITALPDLTGDGADEILLADGAPTYYGGGLPTYVPPGAAFVLSGPTLAPLARLVAPDPSRGIGVDNSRSYANAYHSAVGDFTGDGGADVVLLQDDLVLYSLEGLPSSTSGRPPATLAVRVGPNPARDGVTAFVTLGAPARVEVDVIDVLGRRVARHAETLGRGEQRVALDTRGLASGLYVVTARTASETVAARLTIAR